MTQRYFDHFWPTARNILRAIALAADPYRANTTISQGLSPQPPAAIVGLPY